MRIVRRAAFTCTSALFVGSVATAQYSGLSSEELRAVPFERLRLVVQRPSTEDLAQILDSALRTEWTLTPTYELVDPATFFHSRSDTNAVLLDLFRMTKEVDYVIRQGTALRTTPTSTPGVNSYSSPGSYRSTTTYPPVVRPTESRQVPYFYYHPTSKGVLVQRELFALAEEMVGRQRVAEPFNSTFATHTVQTANVNDGFAALTRGQPQPEVLSEDRVTMNTAGFLALAPMDMHGQEKYGVHDRYRLRMLLRGLQDGVAFVRAHAFTGNAKQSITAQEDVYSEAMHRLKGRGLLLPKGWLLPTQEQLFTERFDGRLHLMEASGIEEVISARDTTRAIVLPLGRKLHFFDPATLEPIYVHGIQWLEPRQLDKLERRWREIGP